MFAVPAAFLPATTTTEPAADATETAVTACENLCQIFLELTQNENAARFLSGIIEPVFELAVIIVLAVLARALLRRVVGGLVERMRDGDGQPGALGRLADVVDGGHDISPVTIERRARRADSMGALGRSIGSVLIWSIAVLMALGTLGLDVGPMIAGAGIIGIALGFGAQDLVKDFLSGVFMLAEDQYGVGDTVDVGEAAGIVEGVSLRTTKIRDVEGKLWHVPNGEIRRVANASQAWARALLDVGIAYGADIDEAIKVIEAVGAKMNEDEEWGHLILEDPEVWGVQNLGMDSVDLRVVIKTEAGMQFKVGRELRRRIKYAMDAEGIEIPFAQRTVWVRNEEPATKFSKATEAKKKTAAKRTARKKSTTTTPGTQASSAPGEV